MRKNMSCMMYATIIALAGCLSLVSILLFRGCARRRIAMYEPLKIKMGTTPGVTTPPGWQPFDGSVAGPQVIEAPSTEYTAGDTTTPVEPKKKPRHPLIAPPGTLGEGGDVRDLIPWIEFTGPEPGSAGSEACEE